MKEFTIKKNEENQRFDKYLRKLLPNAGSSFLYKMLRKKNIICNGKKASVAFDTQISLLDNSSIFS